jgi:hypothetical protein
MITSVRLSDFPVEVGRSSDSARETVKKGAALQKTKEKAERALTKSQKNSKIALKMK